VNIVSPVHGWLALTSYVEYQPVTPPAPVPAGGRVRLTINAEFVNDAGVVTHKKTIMIDEPLDAVG
jgi:hypothetical protein